MQNYIDGKCPRGDTDDAITAQNGEITVGRGDFPR